MWADFLSMIFPKTCWACQQSLSNEQEQLCVACQLDLPQTNFHDFPQDNLVTQKFVYPLSAGLSYLYFTKDGISQKLIHALKYDNCPQVGTLLGSWYGALLYQKNFHEKFDVIIPVPLHPKKYKSRGYNQAEFWAKGLSKSLQIPYESHAILRIVETETQTKKNREERIENMQKVFQLNSQINLANKRILLVDDVLTTGATLSGCIELFQEKQNIGVAVLACA